MRRLGLSRILWVALAGPCLVAGRASAVTAGNVTWSGGAGSGDPYWNVAANWEGGEAPTNPTAGILHFKVPGQDVAGKLEQDRIVGGLNTSAGTHVSPTPTHRIDLNGCTLTVEGDIGYQACCHNYAFTISNGTLQVGSAGKAGRILIGGTHQSQSLTLSPGTRLDTVNLSQFQSISGGNGSDFIDMRGVEWVGDVMRAGEINLQGGIYTACLWMDGSVASNTIEVTQKLRLGGGQACYIGDPTEIKLPAGMILKVGVDADQRGELILSDSSSNADLVARSGGNCTAFLTLLRIGEVNGTASRGVLDLAAMDSCFIDTHSLRIGVDRAVPASTDRQRGLLRLPPGTLTAGDAVIGSATLGTAILDLNGVDMIVTNLIALYPTATLTNRVGATPIGLDVQGTLVDAGGRMHFDFTNAPAVATNWAVRIRGNAKSVLGGMAGAGRLTWDYDELAIPGKKVGIVQDADYTYLAMVDEDVPLGPIASARDELTFEWEPGGRVTVGLAEIDVGSYDPDGRPFSLTISEGGRTSSTSLDFTAIGDYTVTLTIRVGSESHSDTCTVRVVPIPAATAANVRWSGEAPTLLMARREWFWGANWQAGLPPANPTAATIEFFTMGQDVISKLDQDRTIGNFSSLAGTHLSPTPAHVVDLNGYALTVEGFVGGNSCCYNWTLTFSNGTLRVGSPGKPGRLLFGGNWQSQTLTIAPAMRLDAVNLTHVHSDSNTGTDTLDMRGVEWIDNRLRAGEIRLAAGGGSARILLDESVAGGSLIVTQRLRLGSGTGNCYIGAPADFKLPSQLDVTIGTNAAQRAEWVVFPGSRVIARHGGRLTAWLPDFLVGDAGINATAYCELQAMTHCSIDALTVRVGATDPGAGVLILPPGEATIDALTVGSAVSGAGTFHLSGTTVRILSSVTVNATGAIIVEVGPDSHGLDLLADDTLALSVAAGGTITVTFTVPPPAGPCYGLKSAGSHSPALEALVADGRLIIDSAGLAPKKAVIFETIGASYAPANHTYIGLPPPRGMMVTLR